MHITNLDWLEFSVDFADYDESASDFLSMLDGEKKIAEEKDSDKKKHIRNFGFIMFDGLELKPFGVKRFAFILEHEDVQIKIARYRAKNDANYPVRVRVAQRWLWRSPFWEIVPHLLSELCRVFGSPVTKTKLSRLDVCCHTDIFSLQLSDLEFACHLASKNKIMFAKSRLDDFFEDDDEKDAWLKKNGKDFLLDEETEVVHRAGKVITGYSVGYGGKIMARCYDKTREIRVSNKWWFRDIWRKNGWQEFNKVQRLRKNRETNKFEKVFVDEEIPVWNIEFQLRREALREFGIEGVEDIMFDKLEGIWKYLTHDWLTFREFTSNPKVRAKRQPIREDWKRIANAFGEDFEKATRETQKEKERDYSLPQLAGWVTKYAALYKITNINDILKKIQIEVPQYIEERKDTDFDSEVGRKMILMYQSQGR